MSGETTFPNIIHTHIHAGLLYAALFLFYIIHTLTELPSAWHADIDWTDSNSKIVLMVL